MKAIDRAMRLMKGRLPRADGGGTLDDSDAVPAIMPDAIATAPNDNSLAAPVPQSVPQQTRGPRGEIVQAPLMDLSYRTPFIPAQGQTPSEPISYIEDEYGTPHQVPTGTPGARQAPEGTTLQDGSFYNERSPVGLIGKTMGALGYDTPGGARTSTSWGNAARNTIAGLSPGYIADSLERTVKLPGEVWQGQTAPNDVMRNLEFVANVGAGGGAFAQEGAAGIFGGRLAATADHAALARAEEMAAKGVNPTEIYQSTGWFQGPDAKWRFEINDQNAKLKAPMDMPEGAVNIGQMSDVLEHPELYKAYPQLGQMPGAYGDLYGIVPPGMLAGYASDRNAFLLNTPAIKAAAKMGVTRGGTGISPTSSLLHENQHAVQAIEDFSPGTSPQLIQQYPNSKAVNQVFMERRQAAQDRLRDAELNYGLDPNMETERELIWAKRDVKLARDYIDQDVLNAYKRTAGEVEARNVQARMNMSPEQRQAQPPWETQEFPEQKQFPLKPSPPQYQITKEELARDLAPANPTMFANANQDAAHALGAMARSREIDPMGFYSPSLEASKTIPQQVGTVAQMKSMLLKNGAKPKELDAVGFDNAFPDPNAKVNRQDIEDYLRNNRVQLDQTRYGGDNGDSAGRGKFAQYSTPGGENYTENIVTLPPKMGPADYEALRQRLRAGGSKEAEASDFVNNLRSGRPVPDYVGSDPETQRLISLAKQSNGRYTSAHWPGVDNPVLHYRTKDFPGGTRTLEEMQSDWAQRGRDIGVRGDPAQLEAAYQNAKSARNIARNELDQYGESLRGDPRYARPLSDAETPPEPWQLVHRAAIAGDQKALAVQKAVVDANNTVMDAQNKYVTGQNGVPNAPFIGNTSDWTDLGIKNALIDAARNPDVNRIAWTPGSVQNKRYGLEHHVDAIDILPPSQQGVGKLNIKMKNGRSVPLQYDPTGKVTAGPPELMNSPLSDVVGPAVAQRILDQKQIGSLRGMDLSIGGEGMRGYYDKILPNRIQEVMKKQGLGKPEFEGTVPQTEVPGFSGVHPATEVIPGTAKYGEYPSFAMTPEMRQKILSEGLSLFNKGDPYASAVLGAISRGAEERGVGREIGTQAAAGHGAAETGIPGRGELPGGASGVSAPDRAANPYARIPGIPETAKIPGHGEVEANPIPWVVDAANNYSKKSGIEHNLPEAFGPLDRERAARIAQAFEDMKHDPTNPEVRRAYEAMADETLAQYRALKDQGARYYFNNGVDPYAKSPAMGYPELRDQRSLSIFPTNEGFGTGPEGAHAVENSPLLKKTGEKFGDKEATINDLFRAVHDSFGHFGYGNPFFRDAGEERAWMLHSGMYGPEARKAMTTETRGQNSWLNAGPYAEHNKTASGADTIYAPQKTGLLPDWVVNEGANGITRPQYDAIQRAMRLSGKRLFSNADDQLSLPLSEMAREGMEQKGAAPAPQASPKPPKEIVPRDLDPGDEGFYSQQVEALKNQIPMKQGNAQQWRNALKKAGVKDEELRWTGMNDYLDQLERTGHKQIPRDQLLNYAEDNKVIPQTERYVDDPRARERGRSNDDGYSEDQVWERAQEFAHEAEYESNRERLNVDLDSQYMDQFKDKHPIEEDKSQADMFNPDRTAFVIRDGNDILGHYETKDEAEKALDGFARTAAEDAEKYAVYNEDGEHISSYDSEHAAENGLDRIAAEWASDVDPQDWGDLDYWREQLDMPEPTPEEDVGEGARTINYLNKRPKGGNAYTESVLNTPRHALKNQGVKGFDETHISWPQEDINGWLLRENYQDQLSGQQGTHIHEAQSDWSQRGANQGFATSDPAKLKAAQDALDQAQDARNTAHLARPYEYQRKDELGNAIGDPSYYQFTPDQRSAVLSSTARVNNARDRFLNDSYDMNRATDQIRSAQDYLKYTQAEIAKGADENRMQRLLDDENYYKSKIRDRQLAYNDASNRAEQSRQAFLQARQQHEDLLAQHPAVPAEQANALNRAAEEADTNYMAARDAQNKLRSGVSPGPWVNDVPEITKLLLKRGLIDAANEGKDFLSWSSPKMISDRWGQRDYTEPLYGKMIPNTALKLAREHDPNAKVEPVQLGNDQQPSIPRGSFDIRDINPETQAPILEERPLEHQIGTDYRDVMDVDSRAPGVNMYGSSFKQPVKVVYGPSQRSGVNGARYMLHYDNGVGTGYEFATREAAEEAAHQINSELARKQAEQANAPKGNALGIKITPQMRESIKKRGFSAFLNRDPAVASALAAAAQSQLKSPENDDDALPDYVEPGAKRKIKETRGTLH